MFGVNTVETGHCKFLGMGYGVYIGCGVLFCEMWGRLWGESKSGADSQICPYLGGTRSWRVSICTLRSGGLSAARKRLDGAQQ